VGVQRLVLARRSILFVDEPNLKTSSRLIVVQVVTDSNPLA
jgi:hypothetical protein